MSARGGANGPARKILPQPRLLGLRKSGRRTHRDPQQTKERRYRCKRCSKTFSATKGSALYRTHKPHELLTTVMTLMAYGCPVQAIVAAFGLDERTIHRWQLMSGQQCQRLHEHTVQAGGVPLAQVQADELRVRVVGGVMWLASALSVTSRLWLGGAGRGRR